MIASMKRMIFAEGCKILLNTELKILSKILKNMSKAIKNFDTLSAGLSALRNYFDSSTKLLF